jgi:outer membrane receptor protein involved in Fe transport
MKAKQHRRRRPAAIDGALIGGLAIFASHEAVAQTAQPAATNVASAIEEVIVTATRRSTTVEEIPYNISAMSGDALTRTGTTDLAQLANQIPGFNFEDRGPRFAGSTVPIMRGLNASDTERPGMVVEQMPVGTYLGNSPTLGFLPMMDLDRVEVLRGPQGTLYGAGSLGGAIRLIPNSPKLNDWSGSIEGSIGDTAHSADTGYSGSVVLNAPLSPVAALRISGMYEHQPGFIDQFGILARQGNPVTGVPVLANPTNVANSPGVYYNKLDANYDDISAGRVSLLLQPGDALRVELAVNASYVQGVNGDVDNPSYGGGQAPWDPRITFPATGNYQIVSTTLAPYFRHTDLTSLDASYDVGFATVSSTTSYGETAAVTGSDANTLILGLPATYLPYYTGNPINPRYVATMTDTDSDHRFTEELRLVSKAGKTFDYVVGAFYEHDSRHLIWDIYEPGTTAQTVAAGGPLVSTSPDGHTFFEHAPQEFREEALFGELTWHLTQLWQVTGGGRFFHQTLTQNQDFTSYIIDLTGGNSSSNSISDHIFKLNTSYEFTDHQMVYATYSQGFRRGGVNAFPLSGFYQESPAILDYKPDKADNYELGIKGGLDSGLRYSADVFYINWNNPQIGISTPNTWPVAVNGKQAVSKGVELEVHTPIFTPNLNLTLGYSYTDAKLTQSFCLPVGDGTGNPNGFIPCGIQGLNGERLPGTTQNDGSATLSYVEALGPGRKLTYTVNANYRGSTLNSLGTIANNFTPVQLSGYTLVNASISESLTDHLRVGLYGSNLSDKRAVLGAPQRGVAFLGDLANAYTINRPREISLRVAYDW